MLFIGDGMGQAQRDAVRLASVGLEGDLAMNSLPYSGSMSTSPADPQRTVTDSAAGATAIASGVKTYNGAVGVGPDRARIGTLLEEARDAGKATGLVTTDRITGATPAAFAAHVPDRGDQREIARQYVEESRPDVILGGGENQWYPAGEEGAFPNEPSEDGENDGGGTQDDLVEKARQSGYRYVSNGGDLEAAEGPRILGLFANETMFRQNPEGEGDAYDPAIPLEQMTRKALDTLSEDPEGFFLMVEEEAIDEMAHNNNTPLMIEAGRQLDRAVTVAKDFAERSPDTLVIIAADHECGGLTIEDADEGDSPDESGDGTSREDEPVRVTGSDRVFVADWTTTQHTGANVPVTATGPGAERLAGVYENTHLYEVMAGALLSQ